MIAAGRRSRRLLGPALLCGLLLAALPGSGEDLGDSLGGRVEFHPEQPLVQSLFDVQRGRLDDAFWNLSQLIRRQPDFRLAQLVFADILEMQAGRGSAPRLSAADETTDGMRQEALARLSRYVAAPPQSAAPGFLLQIPEEVRSALVVDIAQFRLYLFENRAGVATRVSDYYVSIGKGGGHKRREGDEKTPVGVYRVSSYLPGSTLPDMYGPGAFPISYPNRWDEMRGRTGSGIWIHGTESDRYSRPPLSSLGCVTLSNSDFVELRERVEIERTPVVVSNGIPWIAPEAVRAARDSVAEAVERWRQDWESRDPDRYLSHYAADFRTLEMDRSAFARHKRRVNPSKRFIRVGLEQIGIYAYPGEKNLVLVDFVQRYESDSFRAVRHKQQFWRRENGTWRIVFEEGA